MVSPFGIMTSPSWTIAPIIIPLGNPNLDIGLPTMGKSSDAIISVTSPCPPKSKDTDTTLPPLMNLKISLAVILTGFKATSLSSLSIIWT